MKVEKVKILYDSNADLQKYLLEIANKMQMIEDKDLEHKNQTQILRSKLESKET